MKVSGELKKSVQCPKNCSILNYHGHYSVPVNPVPLARVRFGKRQVWDCQREIKRNTGIVIGSQHGDAPLFHGPLKVIMVFYFPVAKSLSLAKKKLLLGTPHYYKPDLSNLIKFIEDVGNELLYHDDARIALLEASKVYDEEPRTEFIVMEL